MCSDPNAPDPGRFCCMRGWSITVMIFGIVEILFGLSNIPTLISPTCWVCPTNKVDYQATAGYTCSRVLQDDLYSVVPADGVGSAANCTAKGGTTYTPYTCGEAHIYYLTNPVDSATCTEWQGYYAEACCVAGDPPPGQTTTIIQMLGLLVGGLLKVVAGLVLSCCAGKPSPGKMRTAIVTGGIALALDVIFFILGIVWMIGVCVAAQHIHTLRVSPLPHF